MSKKVVIILSLNCVALWCGIIFIGMNLKHDHDGEYAKRRHNHASDYEECYSCKNIHGGYTCPVCDKADQRHTHSSYEIL